jgi:hypothetical protein
MQSIVLRKIVNSTIWIVCGVVVIIIRVLFAQGTSLVIWEGLGTIMIVYGAFRLVWALVKSPVKPVDDSLSASTAQ